MSCNQSYPYPQVFVVDSGGGTGDSVQPPNLIPCWSFPPAQQRMRRKSQGCLGVSYSLALILLLLFLLVFAALGFEAYQILHIQKQLKDARKVRKLTWKMQKEHLLTWAKWDRRTIWKSEALRLKERIAKMYFVMKYMSLVWVCQGMLIIFFLCAKRRAKQKH